MSRRRGDLLRRSLMTEFAGTDDPGRARTPAETEHAARREAAVAEAITAAVRATRLGWLARGRVIALVVATLLFVALPTAAFVTGWIIFMLESAGRFELIPPVAWALVPAISIAITATTGAWYARRLRADVGRRHLAARSCFGCGHGLAGAPESMPGFVRCSECGVVGPRRPGPPASVVAPAGTSPAPTTPVLREPGATILARTRASEAEVEADVSALVDRFPNIGTIALLPVLGIVVAGLTMSVVLGTWTGIYRTAFGVALPGIGLVSVLVVRTIVLDRWSTIASRVIAEEACFRCGQSGVGVAVEPDGRRTCPECAYRSPVRRDRVAPDADPGDDAGP